MERINDRIADKIKASLPHGVKPASYLMNLFNIGVDSAYRRLRGEIPYSFGEIAKLSEDLGFSIDEITGEANDQDVYFELPGSGSLSLQHSLTDMFKKYYDLSKNHHQAKDSEFIITLNAIDMIATVKYPYLLKFFYFKLLRQMNEAPLHFTYSDVVIPPEIATLGDKINQYYLPSKRQYYIIDSQIIFNTMKQIRYYYKRNLISEDDFQLIKKDVHAYIDYNEEITHTGTNAAGAHIEIFISPINIETTSLYSAYDGHVESFFFFHPIPMSTTNSQMCSMHLNWFETLRKYTILISNSNEMLQMEVYAKMRKAVDSTDEEDDTDTALFL